MKICLTTMLNEKFICAYEAFIKSFLHHNKWFKHDFVILNINLSDESKEKIRKYYNKIIFKDINFDAYRNVQFNKTHEKLRCTYYKLDIFSFVDYDKIVFIDMDTIVQADLSELFNTKDDFVAIKTYRAHPDILGQDFNSGVFVVGKKYINLDTYNELVKLSCKGFNLPDQSVLNIFFKGKISWANKGYNCEKRIIKTNNKALVKYKDFSNIKIIHYVGFKPWDDKKPEGDRGFEELEEIYWQWYGR